MCSKKDSGRLAELVLAIHTARPLGLDIHPYFYFFDAAMVAGLAVGAGVTLLSPQLDLWAWALTFVVELLLFQLYLGAKRRFLNIRSRSFLQDTVFFLLPTYIVVSAALGQAIGAALDRVGLMFPVVVALIRCGCFVGGCCYGRSWSGGFRYPPEVFLRKSRGRTFVSGPPTSEPLIPIQILESLVNTVVFVVSAGFWLFDTDANGKFLGYYLFFYACWRFPAEFMRGTRHRPKWGPFSQAQWISLLIILIATGVHAWGG